MADPRFLDLDEVLRLHRELIVSYGGDDGIRDTGMLQSALAMPQATYAGHLLHPDLFAQAAAYLFHLVQNHPFVDGNKRIGAASALVFLAMNDIAIVGDEDGLVELTMATASGARGKEAIASWFRSHAEGHPEAAGGGH